MKRQRVQLSCSSCRKRKEKCDRQQPCGNCIKRMVSTSCSYEEPKKEEFKIEERFSKLEDAIKHNNELISNLMNQSSSSSIINLEQSDKVLQRNTTFLNNLSNSHPNQESSKRQRLEDTINQIELDNQRRSIVSAQTESFTFFDDKFSSIWNQDGTFQQLNSLMPNRKQCDDFMNQFFLLNNWLRQPLSRSLIVKRYDEYWSSFSPVITNENITLYSLIMMINALAALSFQDDDDDDGSSSSKQNSSRKKEASQYSNQYYWAARKSLLMSSMLGKQDLNKVIAYQLACRYNVIIRYVPEALSCIIDAVKTSFVIKLHKDPSESETFTVQQCEERRRIWSNIFFGERLLCLNLARPSMIDDRIVSVQLPSEDDTWTEFIDVLKPLKSIPEHLRIIKRPDFLSFLRIRHRLALILGDILLASQNESQLSSESLNKVDGRLDDLHHSFPDHLRSILTEEGKLQNIDTIWDEIYEFVPVHRYVLQAEILFTRLTIHKSNLFWQQEKRKDFQQQNEFINSRQSCINSAFQLLSLRCDLIETIRFKWKYFEKDPDWLQHLGTFNVLAAIVILGVHLLTDPPKERDTFNILLFPFEYLRSYYEIRKHDRKSSFDEGTERDLMIIQIFYDRIKLKQNKNKGSGTFNESSSFSSSSKVYPSLQKQFDNWFTSENIPSENLDLNFNQSNLISNSIDLNANLNSQSKNTIEPRNLDEDQSFWQRFIDQIVNEADFEFL